MKIKDYKCKCGNDDFFISEKGSQKGIYCTYCGKWLKWANKDEQNLVMKQEPRITWVTGADGAKIAFWDVPVWKVTKICEILGESQESEDVE